MPDSTHTTTIDITPTEAEGRRVIERLIADGAYFDALNVALLFTGPSQAVLDLAREVAGRCTAARAASRDVR